jgi:NADPH:quinone reductase-like Zn-dependent oxidoreductase
LNGAGVIHAVGPEATGFQIGDRVWVVTMFLTSVTVSFLFSLFQGTFTATDQAAYQEFVIVETDIIAKTPDNINDDQASTISTGAITAYYGLFQRSGIAPPLNGPTASGKSVLILGGSSSVGQFGKSVPRVTFYKLLIAI